MTTKPELEAHILVVDDDHLDRVLIKRAGEKARLARALEFVKDGEELLEYLLGEGRYSTARKSLPGLILLDLNMPRMGGYEALVRLKADPTLKHIPVVVLSSSESPSDIKETYKLGSNSFITKPMDFCDLVQIIQDLDQYWFKTVTLPNIQTRH